MALTTLPCATALACDNNDMPFVEDKPLVGCNICLDESANLIEILCQHEYCSECTRKINKYNICREKLINHKYSRRILN
jgi:hypothetical protein